MHGLLSGSISVVFMWVPIHVGLAGNLEADIAVKVALLVVSYLAVPHSDHNSLIDTRALNSGNYVGILKLRTNWL